MYNVDDAVAKIDGYIIEVTDGGDYVGEKRLVRIEEAGRTAAIASLVDNGDRPAKKRAPKAPAEASGDAEEPAETTENGDGVKSRSRRRGRRGGRRRSRAGSGTSSTSDKK